MKAKEVIDNLRANLQAADSQVKEATDQHIMFMLDEARAKLASQKMDAKVNILQMIQTADIKPKDATKAEMGTIGISKILKLEIPDPIAYLDGGGVITVGPTDGSENYTRITYAHLQFILHRKYTATSPKWFFLENAIYIINTDSEALQMVRVRGIFDEPYKVEQVMNRYKYLAPFDWEYPVSMKDLDAVYKIAMAGDLAWGDSAVQSISAARSKQSKDGELLSALKNLGNAQTQ